MTTRLTLLVLLSGCAVDGTAAIGALEQALDGGAVCMAPNPCASCAGCCGNGACQPGTLTSMCGFDGGACVACPAGQLCELGRCRLPELGAPDLTVDPDVVVTDVDLDGGLTLTVTATLRNRGAQATGGFSWALYVSDNATLNGITDELVATPAVPAGLAGHGSVRVTTRAFSTLPKFAGDAGPTPWVFIWADSSGTVVEPDESNNFGGAPFSTDPSTCRPATCSGCCTTSGCVSAADTHAGACGRGGGSCFVCSTAQFCDAGVCQ